MLTSHLLLADPVSSGELLLVMVDMGLFTGGVIKADTFIQQVCLAARPVTSGLFELSLCSNSSRQAHQLDSGTAGVAADCLLHLRKLL